MTGYPGSFQKMGFEVFENYECDGQIEIPFPNRFLNSDCMDVMKLYPDKYFDLALCDPPYGLNEHGGKNRGKYVLQKNGNRLYVPDGNYENRGWDNEPPDKAYFDEVIRISKNQIIFGCNYFDYPFPGGRIIWDKCNDGSDQSDAEIAYNSFSNRVDIVRYMWRGMMQGKSIEEGWIQQGNKSLNEKRITPTQKPVALYKWIIQKYLKPGDKLIDTHVGSASSLIACEDLGIQYVGTEKDTFTYNLADKRLQEHKAQLSIFDYGVERC